MVIKIIAEILILWVIYAIYMEILVRRRGPIGGVFFYPKVIQNRVMELNLITEKELKNRRLYAYILLIAWMIIIPMIMIVFINGARTYIDCCMQFCILFLGAEFYDWLFIDTIWVALSDWWIIPGTEDLLDTWHSTSIKKWKMLKLVPFSIVLSFIIGGLYYLVGLLFG